MAVDRDQQAFINHCRKNIPDYEDVRMDAAEAYRNARDECQVEHQKDNAATKAANLIFLAELKLIGMENWRQDKNGKTTASIRRPNDVNSNHFNPSRNKYGPLNSALDEIVRNHQKTLK